MRFFLILFFSLFLFSCDSKKDRPEEFSEINSDTIAIQENKELNGNKIEYSEDKLRDPVDPEALEDFFPEEYKGYELSKATSGILKSESLSYSTAERYFRDGKSIIIMRISDYVFKENVPDLEYLNKVPQKMDMRGELLKSENYYGNILWDDNKNSGEILVLINDRFLIKLEIRRVIGFEIEVINFLNKFDIESLNKLKDN